MIGRPIPCGVVLEMQVIHEESDDRCLSQPFCQGLLSNFDLASTAEIARRSMVLTSLSCEVSKCLLPFLGLTTPTTHTVLRRATSMSGRDGGRKLLDFSTVRSDNCIRPQHLCS